MSRFSFELTLSTLLTLTSFFLSNVVQGKERLVAIRRLRVSPTFNDLCHSLTKITEQLNYLINSKVFVYSKIYKTVCVLRKLEYQFSYALHNQRYQYFFKRSTYDLTNRKLKIFNSFIYTSQTHLNSDFANCKVDEFTIERCN